eukprot:m.119506 g.119506  ORF g.119506 m.119506 type:complete len:740 (+) comp11022_c0_seq2:396-2615(+)
MSECNYQTDTASSVQDGPVWQIVFTLTCVVAMLVGMAVEYAPADMLMMAAVVLLHIADIISLVEAVQGFSNIGMLTVAVLLIVAEAVKKTGAINPIKNLLGSKSSGKQPLPVVLLRFMVPVTLLSAFMNNTPVVAMMIPVIVGFSNSNSLKPSKLLIPLSFASIFGGTCTLMGTSTNLVVYGLAKEKDPGFEMTLFEIGTVGLPVALAGLLFIVLFGPRYLPNRESFFVDAVQGITEYVVTLVVRDPADMPDGNHLVGARVGDIDLCNVPGVSLVKIQRHVSSHHAASTVPRPGNDFVLCAGDQLFFVGSVHKMLTITQGIHPGLEFVFGPANTLDGTNCTLFEVTIGKQSHLAGKTLREVSFRQTYNASVLGVHRPGSRRKTAGGDLQPLGTLEMRRGDNLLLLANADFKDNFANKNVTDFASVTELSSQPPKSRKAKMATVLCVAMICAGVAGVHLLTAAFVTAALLIIVKCLETNDVYGALNLPVLVVIAAAFGISQAMVNSGAASLIAKGLVAASEPAGLVGLQIVIYMVTVIFSAAVTNNAAVTIMFPIAYDAAHSVNADFRPFMYLLMMGASASFMTPTGYQTNLMVYGPGGYRFSDFLKFGGVLQLCVGTVTIVVMQTLQYWWLWTLLFLGLLACTMLVFVRRCIRARAEADESAIDTNMMSPDWDPQTNPASSMSNFQRELRDLNMRAGQRYTFVPDLGLVPIDDDDELDHSTEQSRYSRTPPVPESESLI